MSCLSIRGIEVDFGPEHGRRKPDIGFRRANRFKVKRKAHLEEIASDLEYMPANYHTLLYSFLENSMFDLLRHGSTAELY